MATLLTLTFSAPDRGAPDGAMERFDTVIAHAFPHHRRIHAVTNAARRGDEPLLQELLPGLMDEVVTIQPCFINVGSEWGRLLPLLKEIGHPNLRLGRPLIETQADAQACAQAILPELPRTPVVFMAHGSKDPTIPDLSPMMEQAFHALGRTDVYFANLEGENNLSTLLPRLKHSTVELRPFLFCPKFHRHRDLEGNWNAALQEWGIQVACSSTPLCAYPGIQQLFIRRAEQANLL